MATAQTDSTILTAAFLGAMGLVLWKLLGGKNKNPVTGSAMGQQANSELGGDSLQTVETNDNNSTLSTSDFSIPYEDDQQQLDLPGVEIFGWSGLGS